MRNFIELDVHVSILKEEQFPANNQIAEIPKRLMNKMQLLIKESTDASNTA